MLKFKPGRRAAALLLSAVMLFASAQFTPPAVAANEWVQESVNKLTSWGVITGRDAGGQQLNANITRAEVAAMINRAYGYTEKTDIPFNDVPPSAWFADDIAIGYNTGYFSGTTQNTASPTGTLTREQAISLMSRNLRLTPQPGEVTEFTDGRSISTWSAGYVKAAAGSGLITGYGDGTFRPKNEITRAEMIKLLADSLGELVQAEGVHTLGGVAGNVTISSPGVTLRDTTIAGDLYLTGGVGLGGVTLENVNVLGRIIISGGGESEAGGESIVLRNVAAQAMIVDTLEDQYLSLSVQNDSLIPEVTLKSSAYIEDLSRSGMGLLNITMDGGTDRDEDMSVTVAGNINRVVNKTPDSHLIVGKGTAQEVVIDESAADSTLTIESDGVIDDLRLETGIRVDGGGDIGKLTVNAAGSTTTMLPDEIIIRPGITANIAGTVMDSKLAQESSDEPRILSGYPKANDIAPNSIVGAFSGNKSGTIYYAVTAEQYGPVEDDDILVNPPTYGPTYTARGRVTLNASDTEGTARIGGLISDGTYYLSAVLVDSRDDRSAIKWVKFTTPDNTVPNFASGYPVLSDISDIDVQLSAMTNKDCEMYYAIFPRGSAAPTANSFLTNSLTGVIASGIFDMKKNTPITEWLTGMPIAGGAGSVNGLLEEQKDYDLYLWLTDREGGLSSAVRRMPFTTVDVTPPEFITRPYVTNEAARAVTLTGSLNENGTIYWVAVPEGEDYPKAAANPNIDTGAHAVTVVGGTGGGTYRTGETVTIVPETTTDDVFYRWQVETGGVTIQMVSPDGDAAVAENTGTFRMPNEAVSITAYFISKEDHENGTENPRLIRGTTITTGTGVALDSEYAKLQVRNGLNAFKKGSVAARELTDFNFNVSGLEAQTRYDVYYVAVDTAGNYGETVYKVTINTLDNIAPKVTQEFTRFADGDTVNTTHPYSNTDIRLIFDEEVTTSNSTRSFLELYQDVVDARNDPVGLQIAQETLGSALASSITLYTVGRGTSMPEPVGDDIIDFRKAVISLEEDGRMIITLRTTSRPDTCALHLHSGTTYFFRFVDIIDTSTGRNRMGQTDLPRFTTISAQIFLEPENVTKMNVSGLPDALEADMAFSLRPMSTSTVDDSTDWDMLLWLDTSCDFEIYRASSLNGPWTAIKNNNTGSTRYSVTVSSADSGKFIGLSVDPVRNSSDEDYPQLNTLVENRKYYYAIHFTQIGTLTDRRAWNGDVNARVNVVAGSSVELGSLSILVRRGAEEYNKAVEEGRVSDIGTPTPLKLSKPFSDSMAPKFSNGYPQFEVGDTQAIMNLMLDRTGTVHYLVAPVDMGSDDIQRSLIFTQDTNGKEVTSEYPLSAVPNSGSAGSTVELNRPTFREAINHDNYPNDRIKKGTQVVSTSVLPVQVNDLEPNTDYFVYFVLEGTDMIYSDYVMLYRFRTQPVIRPILRLSLNNPTVTILPDRDSQVHYLLIDASSNTLPNILKRSFREIATDDWLSSNPNSDISVLQALNQNAHGEGSCSLFDEYASQAAKDDMATFIRSLGAGTQVFAGPANGVNVKPSGLAVNCDTQWQLSDMRDYIFLAVGKSALGTLGSGDAFRATYNINKVDAEPPNITQAPSSLRVEPNGLISGTIELMFDDYLYVKSSTPDASGLASTKAIDLAPLIVTGRPRDDNNYVSVNSVVRTSGSSIRVETAEGNVNTPTRSITVTVSGLNQRGFITFNSALCDRSGNTRRQPLSIEIWVENGVVQTSITKEWMAGG